MNQRIGTIIGTVAALLSLATLIVVLSTTGARPAAAQSTGVPGMRQVTVVGTGEVKGTPDTATVQIGVQNQAATTKDALAQNNEQAQAIISKLKELGVAEKDIQTSNFSISPVYDNQGRTVNGYQISNTVMVTVRNLAQAGTLLDQVVQAGANNVYGVSFSVADPTELMNQAREAAMANAKARADMLAKSGGAGLGQVLVITENIGSQAQPMPLARAEVADAANSVPMQAGEQTFAVSVQVTYGLQ